MKEATKAIVDSGAKVKFTERELARFWSRVNMSDPHDCWPWIGGRDKEGYGFVRHRGVQCRAHRIVVAITREQYVPGHLWVLHRCDNPPCVNPAHLFIGTASDNCQDKKAKGRAPFLGGMNNGMHKLTDSEVRTIRIEYALGNISYAALGAKYGVTETCTRLLCIRKRWAHIN